MVNNEQQTQIDMQGDQIDNLIIRVEDLEEDAIEAHQKIADLRTDFDGIVTTVAELETEVMLNTEAISTLSASVEINTESITQISAEVEANTTLISSLSVEVESNTTRIIDLEGVIGGLEDDIADLKAAALIEDFFEASFGVLVFERSSAERALIDPFCITEEGFIIFNLAVNYGSSDGTPAVTPNITTRLKIDGLVVA